MLLGRFTEPVKNEEVNEKWYKNQGFSICILFFSLFFVFFLDTPHIEMIPSLKFCFLTQRAKTSGKESFPFSFNLFLNIIEVMKMLKNKKFLIGVGVLLAFFSVAVWATSASVSWTPSRYAPYSIEPGSATTTTVTFTNNGPSTINGKKLLLEVRGDATSVVSVTQPNFPTTIKKGDSVSVNLSVQTSSDMPMGVIDGTLVLLETKPNGSTKDVFKTALPIEITISPFLLPPAPDKAIDESTIAGVDVDENGVPDRVDRWIGFTAPDSEKQRVAMTVDAKIEQFFLTDYLAHKDDDSVMLEARVKENNVLRGKSYYCEQYVFGVNRYDLFQLPNGENKWDEYSNTTSKLLALFYDTPERLRNFKDAERPLVATGYPEIRDEQYKQQCLDLGFDPDQLPN